MAGRSSIEWTESTWNPLTGCTKVSPGCKHCYAERMAARLHAMGQPNYCHGFKLTVHKHVLDAPLSWRQSKLVFVNSMSDLFHEDVPLEFILEVMDITRRAWWHQFQILTKRSGRLAKLEASINWPDNVWLGVSVENRTYMSRIEDLRKTSARIKFLSLEPLLGPIPSLELEDIDWVVVGGESGPGARPLGEKWVVNVKDQCLAAKVPFFFKQWGGVNKRKAGRLLQGRTWDELPVTFSKG